MIQTWTSSIQSVLILLNILFIRQNTCYLYVVLEHRFCAGLQRSRIQKKTGFHHRARFQIQTVSQNNCIGTVCDDEVLAITSDNLSVTGGTCCPLWSTQLKKCPHGELLWKHVHTEVVCLWKLLKCCCLLRFYLKGKLIAWHFNPLSNDRHANSSIKPLFANISVRDVLALPYMDQCSGEHGSYPLINYVFNHKIWPHITINSLSVAFSISDHMGRRIKMSDVLQLTCQNKHCHINRHLSFPTWRQEKWPPCEYSLCADGLMITVHWPDVVLKGGRFTAGCAVFTRVWRAGSSWTLCSSWRSSVATERSASLSSETSLPSWKVTHIEHQHCKNPVRT